MPEFHPIIPILFSSDLPRSVKYYTEVLGFETSWIWEEEETFGGVSRGKAQLFFCKGDQTPPGAWICIYMDNVDEYYNEIKDKGANIIMTPTDEPWSMREMLVKDPDGNVIRFGHGTEDCEEDEPLQRWNDFRSHRFMKKSTFSIGGALQVNRMGFGAMRITGEGVWGPPKDRDEAIAVLKKTVELGIDFIDTADSYGPHVSEELIAEALHPYPAGLVIATKGGFERSGPGKWEINSHPDHLKEALEGSLKRLKLDRIQLYQLHRIDPKVPFSDTLAFLKKARTEGLIEHIGLSEVSVDQIREAQEQVPIVSVQNQYSIDNRKWEDVLEYCHQNNIAFIPWNPIAAGKLKDDGPLDKMATKYGTGKNQLALAWLLHHADNILLIPGTSKRAHLEENVKAASVEISEEDMKTLDSLSGQ